MVALRPFSLIVAIATCGLGIVLAVTTGPVEIRIAAAIMAAGLLLQAGVNLINDHADLARLRIEGAARDAIVRHARLGAIAIALACLIGLWLVSLRGWPLLLLGMVGVLGLWGYAAEPVNLKGRGLGIPAVFLLTGVLMVSGAYYAASGAMVVDVIAWSLPFSAFAALLLLANELRDFEEDQRDGHRTLTVRMGYAAAARIYCLLALTIALATLGLALAFRLPLLVLATTPLAALPFALLGLDSVGRRPLARRTGRGYALFSALFLVFLWINKL
ncbi:MAG: prenyltransferase [Pseudomonadota bacterium]